MDDTSQKIIDAAMTLIRDKGYVATTTKEIAKNAGVNECTLFRKFKSKKDIVLHGANQVKWRANVTPELFKGVTWDLRSDIEMFMRVYIEKYDPGLCKSLHRFKSAAVIRGNSPFDYEGTAGIFVCADGVPWKDV